MLEIENKDKCCGCHSCYNICPQKAITMEEDEKGFKYPVINAEKCVNCGLCKKVCPIINSKKIENKYKAYACYNKDENIRKESSSGGIFSLIASEILKKGGVVFGAAFNNEFMVEHIYVETEKELYKLRGSKYLQSTIGDAYKKAKEFLENDRYVLFTGTPCQIEGLLAFLGKKYDKLFTQDIICHGVPSPKVWKQYLKYRNKKDKENPINISFRNKDNGWKSYNLKIDYKNKNYKNNQINNKYMQAFLRNVCLRDSCYECAFKKINRLSDITLADFWGVEKVVSELDDNKGTSLAIINNSKGEELFESIKENIIKEEVKLDAAIKYNTSMVKSSIKDKNREEFFANLEKLDFDKLVKKYTEKPKYSKGVIKIKQVIKKLLDICKINY